MTDLIEGAAHLQAVRFKLVKDADGESSPVVEVVLQSDDLNFGTRLAWHLGQELQVAAQPYQPKLPDTPLEQAVKGYLAPGHKPLCASVMFHEQCDCGFAEVADAAREVLAPSADGTVARVTRTRR